ncbi:MAG: SurA N-terminal domain-containing protein [Kiritimatiellae bacterium]|nr:SurA N-terminal domain-containing protein [Kiritimatiellia bacterium]
MVILQFNKLIRNKWVWGVFAIVVSAAFCFDDLFTSRSSGAGTQSDSAGMLGGEEISREEFAANKDDLLGFGNSRDMSVNEWDANQQTWKRLAAIRTAQKAGVLVSDDALSQYVQNWWMSMTRQSEFNYDIYTNYVIQALSTTPARWGEKLRRDYMSQFVNIAIAGSGVFVLPMEVDVRFMDVTDKFDVRVARFTQSKEKADAITVDDDGLKAWYDKNIKSLELPDRYKVRLVKFDATTPEILAKMEVSEDDLQERYDSTIDKYTTTDTNGVETVKPFADVREEIDKEMRIAAAVEFYSDSLSRRAYAPLAEGEDEKASRLDKIAAEDGLNVTESDWFAIDGKYVDGFMRTMTSVAPGAKNQEIASAVAQLDPEDADLRYGVIASDKAVWLIERSAFDKARTPSFEESKDKVGSKALRDAKADAFKAEVEAIAALGAEAVLASGDVSTNLVFSPYEMQNGAFQDQRSIVSAAVKLQKDQVSDFVSTGTGKGLLVVCVNREQGPEYAGLRENIRAAAADKPMRYFVAKWSDANLARFNPQPSSGYEVTGEATSDEEESDE